MNRTALMARALALAERGGGATSPNPMVGCVLVDPGGTILGEGYHALAGGPHAEVVAIEATRRAGHDPGGSTAIVTLEPCGREGRTPACADALIAAGIQEVVFGAPDPHPGEGGAERLAKAGVRVTGGVLEPEAERLVEAWRHLAKTGRPFFHLKTAQTLNARVTRGREGTGWITGPEARAAVHRMRRGTRAVMAGVGTILADDPTLTVRDWHPAAGQEEEEPWPEVQPVRVVLDSGLRTPLSSRLVTTAETAPVWIFCAPGVEPERERELSARGVEILPVAHGPEGLDLDAVCQELARREVSGVLVEPGPTLATSFIHSGLIDRWTVFLAAEWIADRAALPLLLAPPPAGFRLAQPTWEIHGRDASVSGRYEPVD